MVRAGFRNGYMLLLFILSAVGLNEIILLGNDLIAQAADGVLDGQQVDFSTFIIPLLWMIVLGTAASYCKSIFGNHYSAMVQRDVRASLGKHLVRLPFSYFDEKGSGSIMTRLISDMDELGRFFSEILPNLLINVIAVVTATIYLVQMDVRLIAVLFASYPVMLVVADRLSKKLAWLAQKLRSHMDACNEKAYDAIQGIVIGRSYNLYEVQKKEIDAVIDQKVEQACKSTRISSMGWVLKNIITTIPVILCYLFALYETMQDRITVGEMLAFTVILSRILNPIGDIVFCANDIRFPRLSLPQTQSVCLSQRGSSCFLRQHVLYCPHKQSTRRSTRLQAHPRQPVKVYVSFHPCVLLPGYQSPGCALTTRQPPGYHSHRIQYPR